MEVRRSPPEVPHEVVHGVVPELSEQKEEETGMVVVGVTCGSKDIINDVTLSFHLPRGALLAMSVSRCVLRRHQLVFKVILKIKAEELAARDLIPFSRGNVNSAASKERNLFSCCKSRRCLLSPEQLSGCHVDGSSTSFGHNACSTLLSLYKLLHI
ncbi:hypothetical protein E2C01_065489 [Portunus trituberculatus]|uniref:Uncharacterized protein n=1 Tax=Portunus trituberculatus TaxID=210409 RepID=A0A5B7HPQ6_PORTR|nr:hypothetical protein [Portunus trituberculatus]